MPSQQLPTADPVNEYQTYNPQLSRQRLEVFGFAPEVTTKTQEQLIKEWEDTVKLFTDRPTRDEYITGNYSANLGAYTYSALFTALTRDEVSVENLNATPNSIRRTLSGMMPSGSAIGEMVATDGYKTLESLAAGYPEGWAMLSTSMALWDFSAQKFCGTPQGPVFIALNPEYTIRRMRDDTDMGEISEKVAKERAMHIIGQIHNLCGPTVPFWSPDSKRIPDPAQIGRVSLMSTIYPESIVAAVRSLPHIQDLEDRVKTLEPCQDLVYRPYAQTALDGLFSLVGAIHKRKNKIETLHFLNTPLLDRRMVAMILRACPNVTMIGIYDCPMINFGDVVALLDLIHEVNCYRESENQLPVDAFDFFPHYNSGKPYKDDESELPAAYGITWSAINHEVAQRGTLRIVMEAFLKAREMGLGLLFKEGKAFRKYLSQLPFIAMTPEIFLDALTRYINLHENPIRSPPGADANAKRESLYDVLRQVRQGLENQTHDWPMYYSVYMASSLFFCSSCGHEMPEEFFTQNSRIAAPHGRVCAGCILRKLIDAEDNHQKQELQATLNPLFPQWNPKDFNHDAPMPSSAHGLFKLRTKKDVRDPPPGLQVNAAGQFYQPRYMHELVRDNKLHGDSLQKLPTLDQILGGDWESERTRAVYQAMVTDVNRITMHILSDIYSNWQGTLAPLKLFRVDEGKPNSDFEGQQRAPGPLGFGFEFAPILYKAASLKGFVTASESN